MEFEALVPVARWQGWGGKTNPQGPGFEAYTWAAGISASTAKPGVVSTSHITINHPIIAAKQSAVIDHISDGRFILNIVTGWVQPEIEMFGQSMLSHEERYACAEEWLAIVKRLWTEDETFDHEGEFFKITKGYLQPKPIQYPYPAIMNAGASELGRHFAVKHCDLVFTVIRTGGLDDCRAHVQAYHSSRAKSTAATSRCGRWSISCRARPRRRRATSTTTTSTSRATGRPRQEHGRYVFAGDQQAQRPAGADQAVAGGLPRRAGAACRWSAPTSRWSMRSPTLSKAGLDGVLVAFPRYEDGMRDFRDVTYPLLKQAGLRELTKGDDMVAATDALLTDLYQLNMLQAYLDGGKTETAVFELYMRKLPARRGFLIAAGLEQALDFLERLHFTPDELDWLAASGRFGKQLIDYLATFRFSGDVHAMPEGSVFFADEPILRVTAPLPQAQLVETRLINFLQLQSMVAAKAARMMLAAPGKLLVDFGLRRAHGGEAGLLAARASYVAGFAGTATVAAGKEFGIPLFGTMAHSFIEVHDDESAAFENFDRARRENLTLLIDTYDTEAAARKVVALAPRLKAEGIIVRAVRIDSGDLVALSRKVRRILRRRRARGRGHLRKRRPGRGCARRLHARGRADRRLRHGHEPGHLAGRAVARCRLQAAGICRTAAAQALGRQGDLAGPQAGLAQLRCGRPDERRRALARGRPAAGRAADPSGHAGRPPAGTIAEPGGDPDARRKRARTAAGALAPTDARRILPGTGGGRPGAARRGGRPSPRDVEHDPEKWIPVFGRDHAPAR